MPSKPESLDYTILRSDKRKTLTITVERDCQVVVRAPTSVTDAEIAEIVKAKRHWISDKVAHPQKYRTQAHPPGKELVNGESALYLGRYYNIEIDTSGLEEVQFSQRFLIPQAMVNNDGEALRAWYIQRAKEKIETRVRHFANQMGVEVSKVGIVDEQFRWGSCTPNDNINLNWRLIKAPMFVIDYVIIHELAHLLETNHTPRFWNIVRAQIVNVDKAKDWLKDHGQLLEERI